VANIITQERIISDPPIARFLFSDTRRRSSACCRSSAPRGESTKTRRRGSAATRRPRQS